MAVVSNNPADQENQTGTAQGNTSGGNGAGLTTVVSGSKGGSGASSNAAPTVQSASNSQNSTPSSSGSFTNLKNYLNANNGGQQFTQQINNNFQKQGQQLQANVNTASQDFNQQAQSVVNPYQQSYQNFNQNGGNTGNAQQITNYAQDNNHANSVRNLENASYTGPKSLNDLQGTNNGNAIQSNINNYSQLANNTGTESGRFSLLQNMFGGQGYNRGQQTLDNLFVNPNQLVNARANANQVQNTYNQAANTAATEGQQYQNQLQGYAQNTVNSLNNAVGGQGNNNSAMANINNDYQNAQNAQNTTFGQYQKDLASGKISQAEADAMNLKSGMNLYNVDASNYLNKAALDTHNTATGQDYSQVAALNNLLGNNANFQSQQTLQDYATPEQTLTPDKYVNYDATGLQNAAQLAGQQYKDSTADAINTLNSQIPVLGGMRGADVTSNLNGGNVNNSILADQNNLVGKTFAQLGINGGFNPVGGNDNRGAAIANDELNYFKSQGYTPEYKTVYTPQQQQQMNDYQTQINALVAGGGGNSSNAQAYRQQLANLQAQGGQQFTGFGNDFYQKASPLDFLKAMLNNKQYQSDAGYAENMGQATNALQNIINANNQYTPGRQLEIGDQTPASGAAPGFLTASPQRI